MPDRVVNPATGAPTGATRAIFLIVLVDLMGFGLIIPLLPFYARTLQASPLQVTLLFSLYSICQFIAAPILGLISDRIGRRPVLIASQFGSVAGYILLGWATQHPWQNVQTGLMVIYLSRIIDGLSGGNISTAQAYISDVTPAESRSRGMGLIGAALGIGFIGGPALGGALAAAFGEAMAAYGAAALAGCAALMTLFMLPESRVRRPADAEVWLHPRVFLPVLRNRLLLNFMVIWFISMSAFVMVDSTIAMYLNDVFKFGGSDVAWYFVFVGLIIAAIQGGLIGRLTKLKGEWFWCVAGPLMVVSGYLVTMTTAWHALPAILVVGGATYAAGRSFMTPTLQALFSQHTDGRVQGVAFGLFQSTGTLARAVAPLLAGALYSRSIIGPMSASAVLAGTAVLWTALLWWSQTRASEAAA